MIREIDLFAADGSDAVGKTKRAMKANQLLSGYTFSLLCERIGHSVDARARTHSIRSNGV